MTDHSKLTDEELVDLLVAAAETRDARHLVEYAGDGRNVAAVRGLAPGHSLETVAWALVRQDVAALFGAPPLEPTRRVELHGDVRAPDVAGTGVSVGKACRESAGVTSGPRYLQMEQVAAAPRGPSG